MTPEEKQDGQLPLVISDHYRSAYPPAPASPTASVLDNDVEEPTVPLSHYLWILRRHRWNILAFVGACVVSTLIVCFRLTPIYESTATIDIDRRMPTRILGEEAMQSSTNDADEFLATQIKLLH